MEALPAAPSLSIMAIDIDLSRVGVNALLLNRKAVSMPAITPAGPQMCRHGGTEIKVRSDKNVGESRVAANQPSKEIA